MESADHEVIRTTCEWLDAGQEVYLVTVLRTFGSSPRPPGSILALREDSTFVGSVSGGCMEYDLARRARENQLPDKLPAVLTYGVTREEAQRFGLPCGGQLELAIEKLDNPSQMRELRDGIEGKKHIARTLNMGHGDVEIKEAGISQEFHYDGDVVQRVFGPQWRLIITGAGQLSRFTAQMGLALDYDVVVCDPRTEIANQWNVPGTTLDTRMPDDVVIDLTHERCAVLALMHDPKLDDLALLEALERPAFYVGALGSKANNEKRRKRLAKFGLSAEKIARLHGPVGIPLGGKTPAEIALATMAGVTRIRYKLSTVIGNPHEDAMVHREDLSVIGS